MNIGRQLKRVKVQADQLFLRGDKTDVVGELRTAEERVEDLRNLCESYTRAVEKCIHTHQLPEDKKHKKVPVYQVAESLKEALGNISNLSDNSHDQSSLLKNVVEQIVEAEQALGLEVVEFEDQVEKWVLVPLYGLLKEEFPSIAKQKKSLKQVGLDLDSAKTRWRNSQSNLGQNAKMETYREELEDAEGKLEQARDTYATDIFTLLSREREISDYFAVYLELQHEHMINSLNRLKKVLPCMETVLGASACSPVYGVPLHKHLRIIQQDIALPINLCVKRLVEVGLHEEGLFRVAGSASKVRRLRAAFEANLVSGDTLSLAEEADSGCDVHVVAGALKSYLRKLPEPLLTHLLHDQWLESVRLPEHQARLQALWSTVARLPPINAANLRHLIKFLALLSSHSAVNKMTPANIAIVMAPNLIWDVGASAEDGKTADLAALNRNMSLSGDYRAVVEHLVEYADYFFKDPVDYGVPPRLIPPPSPSLSVASRPEHVSRIEPGFLPTHRRTASADLLKGTLQDGDLMSASIEAESPKQVPRLRKKQAPLPPPAPPQVRPASAICDQVDIVDLDPTSDRFKVSFAQDGQLYPPLPHARLVHTNSLKRPTAEPPKPPGSFCSKPTRPLHGGRSSPLGGGEIPSKFSTSEDQTEEKFPVGFCGDFQLKNVPVTKDVRKQENETLSLNSSTSPIDLLNQSASLELGQHGGIEERLARDVAPKRFSKGLESRFRKELDSNLLQQISGSPPKYGWQISVEEGRCSSVPRADFPKEDVLKGPPQNGVAMPTPFQRTNFPVPITRTQTSTGEKPEPLPRPDKPSIAEKPNLTTRNSTGDQLIKPHVPERPLVVLPFKTPTLRTHVDTSKAGLQSGGSENDPAEGAENNVNESVENQLVASGDKTVAQDNCRRPLSTEATHL